MPHIALREKVTGQAVENGKVEARPHITNYQAMISWRSIVSIEYGNSLDEAIQSAFDKFKSLGVLSHFDIQLVS